MRLSSRDLTGTDLLQELVKVQEMVANDMGHSDVYIFANRIIHIRARNFPDLGRV